MPEANASTLLLQPDRWWCLVTWLAASSPFPAHYPNFDDHHPQYEPMQTCFYTFFEAVTKAQGVASPLPNPVAFQKRIG